MLTGKKCRPCEGIGKAYDYHQAKGWVREIPSWQLDDSGKKIVREFNMRHFTAAIDFINKIAKIAEEENHHPDIHLVGYRKLRIELSTHAAGGLSENDFILAAKIDQIPAELKAA